MEYLTDNVRVHQLPEYMAGAGRRSFQLVGNIRWREIVENMAHLVKGAGIDAGAELGQQAVVGCVHASLHRSVDEG